MSVQPQTVAAAGKMTEKMVPSLLPPSGRLLLEQASNERFFWGSPIVKQALEKAPPELQYDEYTSAVAIEAGKILKVSPARIDHAIESIFGSVSRTLLGVTGRNADVVKHPPAYAPQKKPDQKRSVAVPTSMTRYAPLRMVTVRPNADLIWRLMLKASKIGLRDL